MPIKLSDLIKKSKNNLSDNKDEVADGTTERSTLSITAKETPQSPNAKQAALAALKAATDNTPLAPVAAKPLSKPGKIQLNIKTNKKQAEEKPPAPQLTPEEIELQGAKEFQHPGQPEKFDQARVDELKENLELLKNNISNRDIVGQSVARIMSHLQKYDFLKDMMLPEDCGLMVEGLRESYGMVISKKKEKAGKRAEKEKTVGEIENLLGGMEFEI